MSELQIILKKVSSGEETVLVDGLVAGRLADSGLILTEGHPSRRHAQFDISGDESRVKDLGSANGTFVNDMRIHESTVLRSGDRIRFDIEEFEFQIRGDKTVREDVMKTEVRQVEPIDVESSVLKEKPSWIDPEKQMIGGPKTEFIDTPALKEMIDHSSQGEFEDSEHVKVPALIITAGAKAGLRINLQAADAHGEWTIGSDTDRDVVLQDQGISGVHAKLAQEGRRWKLVDQMSANGTFVNGKRSNMSYLDNGDRIRFGPVECVFRIPSSFGTATSVTRSGASQGRMKNFILGLIAFAITLGIIFLLSTFG